MVLAFGTRTTGPPAKEAVAGLAGIVACSPLVLQTFPAPKALRFIGGKASTVFPALLIDAPIAVDVSNSLYARVRADYIEMFCPMRTRHVRFLGRRISRITRPQMRPTGRIRSSSRRAP